MVKLEQRVVLLVLLSALCPAECWYKQAAGPSYYSVGRAAGLLSGIRRSPFRRAELDSPESGESENLLLPDISLHRGSPLTNTNICVKDMTPNLKSCEVARDARATLRCEATVLIALDSSECVNP